MRVVGAANQALRQRAENFHGFHAQLLLFVEDGLMDCQLKQSTTGIHMLSVDAHGDGDEHLRHWRAFAICEKQLFSEKMVAACFIDHNKIKD